MALPTPINLSNTTPAAPTGRANASWQSDSNNPHNVSANVPTKTHVGFCVSSGAAASNAAGLIMSSGSGAITRVAIVVTASDLTTALGFDIKQNGTSIFSSTPSIAAGTAPGTKVISTSLANSPQTVTQDDVFLLDITAGSTSWQFTVQVEGA